MLGLRQVRSLNPWGVMVNRGATWAKWDLHVHTPASFEQGYGDRNDAAIWNRFVDDLEASTPDHAVLGICDYLTVDGYERLLDYQAKGRLANKVLLPVVELRLTALVGHEKLRRINYHVVFSEKLHADMIRSRFLRSLHAEYVLKAGDRPIEFAEFLSDGAVAELGTKVREALPPKDKARAKGVPDFVIGMNSINFDLGQIKKLCKQSNALSGATLTAIGKNEWADIKWNDKSVAEKRHLICDTDFALCASDTAAAYQRNRTTLIEAAVNDHLVDASDAHYFSTADNSNRIGQCQTWIKAETSFEGLKAALGDFDERVHVGSVPPAVERVRARPDLFIDAIAFAKAVGATTPESWFDGTELRMNSELVAVIGNKGSGKSALLDCIALAGGARTAEKEYSFLSKFRRGGRPSLASQFECELAWRDAGDVDGALLSLAPSDTSTPRVHHLPQSFIEIICNEQHAEFMKQIERVMFGRIPASETHGKADFAALREYLADSVNSRTAALRADIHQINETIDNHERELSPASIEAVRARLAELKRDLKAHEQNRPVPPDVSTVDKQAGDDLTAIEARVAELNTAITEKQTIRATYVGRAESAKRLRTRVKETQDAVLKLEEHAAADLSALGLGLKDIVALRVNTAPLRAAEKAAAEGMADVDRSLDPNAAGSLVSQMKEAASDVSLKRDQLTAPDRLLAAHRQAAAEWESRRGELVGDPATPDSIRGAAARLRSRVALPGALDSLRACREAKTREIHQQMTELCHLQEKLHQPVDEFIKSHPDAKSGYSLAFGTRLVADSMQAGFLDFINKNKSGTFHTLDGAARRFEEVVAGVDLGVEDNLVDVLDGLLERLSFDVQAQCVRDVRAQVDDVEGLYDYLFGLEYLKPQYGLTFNDRRLEELSPGEKGALLLIFFLLVDSSELPLLIDQPEENLDNQSIYEMLVPYLREAAHKRQVIIVTHNPNIAVACNADQVITCSMDKLDGNRITYEAGALEEPTINAEVVDVLEGTLPAFNCRDARYEVTRKMG